MNEKDNTLSFGGYLKISGSLFLFPQVIVLHDFDIIILHHESFSVNCYKILLFIDIAKVLLSL